MEEIWKDIPGYEGLYQVSNKGRVYGIKRKNILAAAPNEKGYMYVVLCKNNRMKSYRVHRLVMTAFIGNVKNMDVNHIDGDKKNNALSNLEYLTHYDNMQHAKLSGLIRKKPVIALDNHGNIVKEYESIKDAEEDNHIVGIGMSIKRGSKSAGYYWKYRKEIKNEVV